MRRLAFFVLALFVLLICDRSARACGGFAVRDREPPFLSAERVLLLWDAATETEDFVREVRFERVNTTFGFVVPTPAKPGVFAVKDAPFDRLAKAYKFKERDAIHNLSGAGGGAAKPAVEVLSQQRIGSFTAFTLAATDAAALDRWLSDNGLTMTPEAKPWVAHYVKLGFFFVAFRYEGSDAGADLTSETVRIRFKTPHPYYPYLEPTRTTPMKERRLDVWLLTQDQMHPVSAYARSTANGLARWTTKALSWSWAYTPTRAELATVLGKELAALLPAAELLVQPFRDHKVTREDFGDVLFVPMAPVAFTPAQESARAHLLPILDPTLAGEPPWSSPPPAASVPPPGPAPAVATPPPAPSTAPGARSSCSLSTGSDSGASMGVALAFAIFFVLRRRARPAALVLLAACDRPSSPPPPTDAAVPSSSIVVTAPTASVRPEPPLPSRDEAARKKAALAVLAGEKPHGSTLSLFSEPGFFPWREDRHVKPDPEFPWREVWIGPSSLSGKRGEDFLRRVAEREQRLSACYLEGLRTSSTLEGDVALTFAPFRSSSADAGLVNVVVGSSAMPARVNECIVHSFDDFGTDHEANLQTESVKTRLTFSRQR